MTRRAAGKRRETAGRPEETKSPAAEQGPGELQRLLRHRFRQPELLELALTHRSFVFDSGARDSDPGDSGVREAHAAAPSGRPEGSHDRADPSQDNEQLEFLGDAVLGLLTAEELCRRFPGSREGELTRLRASVVSRRHLGEVGTRMSLGRWLRLGHTAESNAGRTNTALFANALEALIAALYLDGGLEAARRFVAEEILAGALPESVTLEAQAGGDALSGAVGDFKSALQEKLQAEGKARPQYSTVSESGPDHRRVFRVEVTLDGLQGALAEAEGSTKKMAQQEAARIALGRLSERTDSAAGGVAHG